MSNIFDDEIDKTKWSESPAACKYCGANKLAGHPCFQEFCIERRNSEYTTSEKMDTLDQWEAEAKAMAEILDYSANATDQIRIIHLIDLVRKKDDFLKVIQTMLKQEWSDADRCESIEKIVLASLFHTEQLK